MSDDTMDGSGGSAELAPGLHIIDLNFMGEPGVIAAYLLADEAGEDLALIETGPGSTIPALLDGIRAAGYDPAQIQKLLVTHIHLDHAGAAGELLGMMPQATLYVHEAGAPHMIDPTKLLASAQRIYGEDMDRLWGAFLPVPEDRLVVLRDGDKVQAGGRELDVLYTPGHASHHVAFYDPANGGVLFTGDVAGVRLQGCSFARPPTPPPDLDIELWNSSIERIFALNPVPGVICLTHFGPFNDAPRHLSELRMRLEIWGGIVLTAMRQGQSRDEIIRTLTLAGNPALRMLCDAADMIRRYELAGNYAMTVDGYIRYHRKREPDLANYGK